MPKTITGSVGRGGKNFPPSDVMTVQYLLNCVPATQGGPAKELAVDGAAGPKTIAAIEGFQRKLGGFADGRVDPGGATLRALQARDPNPNQSLSGDAAKSGGGGAKSAPGGNAKSGSDPFAKQGWGGAPAGKDPFGKSLPQQSAKTGVDPFGNKTTQAPGKTGVDPFGNKTGGGGMVSPGSPGAKSSGMPPNKGGTVMIN
jgi:peptidoglycan hydrolase-like protein with peptidoglycan-binding domain